MTRLNKIIIDNVVNEFIDIYHSENENEIKLKQKLLFVKKYSSNPNHTYWFDGIRYCRIEPLGKKKHGDQLFMYHYFRDNKEVGGVIVGLNLYKRYRKITKEEYESMLS